MYISGRSVKSGSKKVSPVVKATREARAIVDKMMPGAGATVESKLSYDLAADVSTVVTTITFSETTDASDVACWAERAPGVIRSTWSTCSITVTRAVA